MKIVGELCLTFEPISDNVLLEHVGLAHVIPLADHLDLEWVILSHYYSLSLFIRGLLHA